MSGFPITRYGLASRSSESRGLVCDQGGAMLGPVALVFPASSAGEGRVFQAVAAERLREILEAAYGPDFDLALAERTSQLQAIARALTENRMADALIGAVHLRLPELSEAAVQRLAALAKYSPDQPRVPEGKPRRRAMDARGRRKRLSHRPAAKLRATGVVYDTSFRIPIRSGLSRSRTSRGFRRERR